MEINASTSSKQKSIVLSFDRERPYEIIMSNGKYTIKFSKQVTALAFFHHASEIQNLCEGKMNDVSSAQSICFDLQNTEWFDTLALCYIFLFVYEAKKRKIHISFKIPKSKNLLAFLIDNGFYDQFVQFEPNVYPEKNYWPQIPYSSVHECFLPLQVLSSKEEIKDIIDTTRDQISTLFKNRLGAYKLESTINKVSYYLQEALDNVYIHAYGNGNGYSAVLIKYVHCEDVNDIDTYQKDYVSKAPYLKIEVFENYYDYFEIYIADVGMGFRNSFLTTDELSKDITEENIISYVFSEGKRSHKKRTLLQDTKFGGLFDIFQQFRNDRDSLGIKGESSWYFNAEIVYRVNTEVPYKTLSATVHGSALVAAIQIEKRLPEQYEYKNVLSKKMNSFKKILEGGNTPIYKEYASDVFKEYAGNVVVRDYRPRLDGTVKKETSSPRATVCFPDYYMNKSKITEVIQTCATPVLVFSGIQESEVKKYQSLIKTSNRHKNTVVNRITIITDTLYVFVYLKNNDNNGFVFSADKTLDYIVQGKVNDIGTSLIDLLEWDRLYNSICIWRLIKEADLPVFLNNEVKWSEGVLLHGYLDFSQLCRIPICRDFCINRLKALHFFSNGLHFESLDRFTDDICEQANYRMGNDPNGSKVYVGSVFVSGSSSKTNTTGKEAFYFFKHSNSNEKTVMSIFEWASRSNWVDKSFPPKSGNENYRRIGFSPFVADGGPDFWAKKHYDSHNVEYHLEQSEIYGVLQRKVGCHPSAIHLAHVDCSYRHDLFAFRSSSLFDADYNLNQLQLSYNESSCYDFIVMEIISALVGKCSQKQLKETVLNKTLSLGRVQAICKKYSSFIKTNKKSQKSIVVYLYNFQTIQIVEKLSNIFSEDYQRYIIPIIPVDRNYGNLPFLIPPLHLERIQEAIRLAQGEKTTVPIDALLFIATPFSVRQIDEIEHALLGIGINSVRLLSLFDRQRLLLKQGGRTNAVSFGRIDLPSLGSKPACPVCNSLSYLEKIKDSILPGYLADRLEIIIGQWSITKESDNLFGKGISLQSINLSQAAKGLIDEVSEQYKQGHFNIWTNIALAMFSTENAAIVSCPDFLDKCLQLNSVVVADNEEDDPNGSANMKILIICVLLLSEEIGRIAYRQIVGYAKKLFDLVSMQNEVSDYSGMAILAVSALPSDVIVELWEHIAKRITNIEEILSQNYDAILMSLIAYSTSGNKAIEEMFAPLLRCFFKTEKQRLDFIYDAFLNSERDYHQSHVQALVKISSLSSLPDYVYSKGIVQVEKLIELVSSDYYSTLFHVPERFQSKQKELLEELKSVKFELFKVKDNPECKQTAKVKVDALLNKMHEINLQGIYLRAPDSTEKGEDGGIGKWLKYCKEKAYERVNPKQRYDNILIDIQVFDGVEEQFRPWFYTFSDVTEEIINLFVDMFTKKNGRVANNGIVKSIEQGRVYDAIVTIEPQQSYLELSFFNSTTNTKTIKEIRQIKRSKSSRITLLIFQKFDKKLELLSEPSCPIKSLTWDYVQDDYKGCVSEDHKLFRATVRIPYIDMGSSSI